MDKNMDKKENAMHSLRWKFFAFFIGLGLSISLVMYIPYSRYIKTTYREKLVNVLQLIDINYHHVMSDPENLVRLGTAGSREYWDVIAGIKGIADIFDITYIYYVRRNENTFQFLLASEEVPGTLVEEVFSSYEEDDIPQAMEAAYKTRALQITPKPHTDRELEKMAGAIADMDFSGNIDKFRKDEIGRMMRA
jgi:hypothetical protein